MKAFVHNSHSKVSASPPPRTGVLLAAVIAAGCGSRSSLTEVGDSGLSGAASGVAGNATTGTSQGGDGAGGAGAGGTAGAGGSGGAGASGGSIECGAIAIAGPPALLEGGFGHHERHPLWTLSSNDGEHVTLVSSRQAAEGPAGADFPIGIVHTTLEPWGVFPSGGVLGPDDFGDDDGGATLAAARAPGGRFALLFADALPPDGGLLFSAGFVPFDSTPPPSVPVDSAATEARFAVQGPGGHLLGRHGPGAGGDAAFQIQASFAGEDGVLSGDVVLGCASSPMYADAVRAPGGFLVGLSNGGAFLDAACIDPEWAGPDDVHIASSNGIEYDLVETMGAPGGATDLKMAGRSDGAWIVVGTPPGQVVSGMFIGARLGPDGKIISMFPAGGSDPDMEIPQNGTLAAAAIGDHLAVAWIDHAGDKGPFLRVKVFDPEGNAAGHVEIFPSTSFAGGPALLGSPASAVLKHGFASLLVAWPETPDQGMGDGDKIRAVRIDCVGSP
jgi:hypothetical protein